MEIANEMNSLAILLPSADSKRVDIRYIRKYVHEVLVSQACPGKSAGRRIDHPDMIITVDWDVKHQTKSLDFREANDLSPYQTGTKKLDRPLI